MSKPWNELTGIEKREAIALRLGLPVGTLCSEKNVHFEGSSYDPSGYHCSVCEWEGDYGSDYGQIKPHLFTCPDWPANDALAFTEVVPKIAEFLVKSDSSLYLAFCEKGFTIEESTPTGTNRPITGFTKTEIADAICNVAYNLLPVKTA